jgi:hypothetical protein
MKIARVIPLFKAEDRDVFTNYRPVSILPSFSKFIERIVYNRFWNTLINIIYYLISSISTSLALVDLYDNRSWDFSRFIESLRHSKPQHSF